MKIRKREERKNASVAAVTAEARGRPWWPYGLALLAAVVAFWAYSPALNAPFMFDDNALPFAWPGFEAPLGDWVSGVRPALMFTYWLNVQLSGNHPFSFHVFNVLLHWITTALVFLIVRRLLEWSGTERGKLDLPAGIAAAIFLLHPLHSETVAYIAARSEGQSVMFAFLAFTVFLYRRQAAISWRLAFVLFLLFALALLSKEQTIVLPALFLLADYWWNPGFSFRGIRANWRLYGPLALGAVAALFFFSRILAASESAGFNVKDFTWYQYLFTQFRALFVYVGLFLFPANLTADWDYPISHTVFDQGAIFGLIALVGLAALAWSFRRRFPLASFGFFAYLLLMSPTSSVLPIQDVIAERRAYFSTVGLLLMLVDFVRRANVDRKVLVGACVVVTAFSAVVTHARAQVWSAAIPLWEDTVRKSPNKPRAHFQLGFAYFEQGRFQDAISEFEKTGNLPPITQYNLLIDWALALDGLGRSGEAIQKLHEAAAIDRTAHVYSQIAMIEAKRAEWKRALDALAEAERVDPNYAPIHLYRGKVYLKLNQPAEAVKAYRRALQLDPKNAEALQELRMAEIALGQAHR